MGIVQNFITLITAPEIINLKKFILSRNFTYFEYKMNKSVKHV